jgi:pimeloyl-ACP methyl ester carboxylesterase
MIRSSAAAFLFLLLLAAPARAQAVCDPDAVQESGSIYRICMPGGTYNGSLVIWAHGFQDAGVEVGIPDDQLCFADICLPDLITGLGFGFATNSYSKTGLAVLQGKADVLDLVDIFTAQRGKPNRVYLVGASEGGIITALSLEQHPDVFSAGLAACGPIGNFRFQINYFGDARATFEYFFPGVIPGDPFNPDPGLAAMWKAYYDAVVEPIVFHPANRPRLDQWVRVAKLPFEAGNYLASVAVSVEDVLRYAVVNLNDAAATLGGFPFDNRLRRYAGSADDTLLNLLVRRVAAHPAAVAAMNTDYATTGVLERPLITLHTLRDQQVPYAHEPLYILKTLASGSYLTRHLNVPIDRFEHCNFTSDEALFGFLVMLLYDGAVQEVSGTGAVLAPSRQAEFDRRARAAGVLHRRAGDALSLELKPAH